MMYWNYDYYNKHRSQHQHHHQQQHQQQQQQQHKSNGQSYLHNLVGKKVKINRGGPNLIFGKLLSVQSDYLVVGTEEGITYVKTNHIKSITDLGGSHSSGHSSGHRSDKHHTGGHHSKGHRSKGNHKKPKFIKADDFKGILRALNKKFVQVNWGGPEKVEGFLADVGKTHILVVSDHKKVDIPIDHIQSVKTEMKKSSSGGSTGGTGGTGGRTSGGSASAQKRGRIVPASKGTALKRLTRR